MADAWDKLEEPLIEAVTELLRGGVLVEDIVRRVEEIAAYEEGEET